MMAAHLREADLAHAPESVSCGGCGSRFILLPGQRLPLRWSVVEGVPLCSDCGPSAEEAFKASLCSRHERVIGLPANSKWRGCRIVRVIQLGMVGLEIRAGTSAPPGRDDAVSFMLDELALDQMIRELQSIRADLAQSERLTGPSKEMAHG